MSALGSPKHRKLRTKLLNGKIFVQQCPVRNNHTKNLMPSLHITQHQVITNSAADDCLFIKLLSYLLKDIHSGNINWAHSGSVSTYIFASSPFDNLNCILASCPSTELSYT